jgi:hypothetical protein
LNHESVHDTQYVKEGMKSLKGKKILLFAPQFFGYDIEIKNKLMEFGALVALYDERPLNTFFGKAAIRINNRLLTNTIELYYEDIFKKIEGESYDFVLFVNPEAITEKAFIKLRKNQKNAVFILYMWDALTNKKNTCSILNYFDYRFSFDKADCLNPALDIQFRPVFYLDEYSCVPDPLHYSYDLCFIGSIHSDRHRILMDIDNLCRARRLKFYKYMFFPSRTLYHVRKMYDPGMWGHGIDEYQFTALNKREIVELTTQSNVIVDIHHPNQTGLTIRTIEMLAARRKVITTNREILNYDFYHPNNIHVIERRHFDVPDHFLEAPFLPLEKPQAYHKYSINGWLEDLFAGLLDRPLKTV